MVHGSLELSNMPCLTRALNSAQQGVVNKNVTEESELQRGKGESFQVQLPSPWEVFLSNGQLERISDLLFYGRSQFY